jgi:type IX secretion system PorP/SprF family membrane protein
MKKSILLLVFAAWLNAGFGQQIPMYSQYHVTPFIYNPAMTGADGYAKAFLVHHAQWTDMPGAPVTSYLTLDAPVKPRKVGLGLKISNDVTDIIHRIGADVSYSYQVNFAAENRLLFGVSIGALETKIDFPKARVKQAADPFLFKQPQQKTSINATAGIGYTVNKLEIGLAVPQLFGNSLSYSDNESRAFYNMTRHFLGSVRYKIDLQKDKGISFSPLVMARVVEGAPLQYDINGILDWENVGWLAASYRSDYAITANVGIRLNKSFTIGYAYDFITSKIGAYAGTSHEILIGFRFDRSKKDDYVEKKNDKDTLAETVKQLAKQVKQNSNDINATDALVKQNSKDIKAVDSTLQDHIRRDTVSPVQVVLNKKEKSIVEKAFKNLEFETNKAEIKESSNSSLDDLAKLLSDKNEYNLLLSGHTDNVGSLTFNFELSEKRVFAVKNYLVGKGISSDRIITEEFGFTRPLEPNSSSEGRSKNRRVEFKIVK